MAQKSAENSSAILVISGQFKFYIGVLVTISFNYFLVAYSGNVHLIRAPTLIDNHFNFVSVIRFIYYDDRRRL